MPEIVPEIYAEKIFVFKNIISDEECSYVIDMMNNMDSMLEDQDLFSKLRPWQTSSEVPHVYGSQRRSDRNYIPFAKKEVKDFYLKLDNAFRKASDIYFEMLGIEIIEENYKDIALCRYNTGESMGPHPDYDGEDWLEPIATGLLYLNSDKVGGDIYFQDHDVLVKSEAGTLVIFPCKFIHESTLIESGEKYHATTGWKRFNKKVAPDSN